MRDVLENDRLDTRTRLLMVMQCVVMEDVMLKPQERQRLCIRYVLIVTHLKHYVIIEQYKETWRKPESVTLL